MDYTEKDKGKYKQSVEAQVGVSEEGGSMASEEDAFGCEDVYSRWAVW